MFDVHPPHAACVSGFVVVPSKTNFARNKQSLWPPVVRWFMELWRQQGFNSFGDWRRAAEKARRAAKKAQASTVAMPAPASPTRRIEAPTALWQPPEVIQPPAVTNSPLKRTDDWERHRTGDQLPGDLHEDVQVTPRGSRAHTITHASPGGTLRAKQHVSPPSSPNLNRVPKVDMAAAGCARAARKSRCRAAGHFRQVYVQYASHISRQ